MGRVSLLGASLDMVRDGDLLEDALILTEEWSWWVQWVLFGQHGARPPIQVHSHQTSADRALQAQPESCPDRASLQIHQYQRFSKAGEGRTTKMPSAPIAPDALVWSGPKGCPGTARLARLRQPQALAEAHRPAPGPPLPLL